MPELPEEVDDFLVCLPTSAIVRAVLVGRLHRSPLFVIGCCQSSALLSGLGSDSTYVIQLIEESYHYLQLGFSNESI